MALENYRITEFQEKTQVDNGDYVLIDSATDGTHKYQLSRIPAQASAEVAAAVESEAGAREAADSTLDGKIGTLSNLTTDAKGSLVAAVNEVDAHADANTSALSGKVDKVAGKGLSKNDFTDALKTKLDGIEAGAEVNDVTSVAGKTGAVTLAGGDVSYSDETTYAAGTVGAAVSGLKSDLGTLSSLTTTAKTNLVEAINEVDAHADANASAIASLGLSVVDGKICITYTDQEAV